MASQKAEQKVDGKQAPAAEDSMAFGQRVLQSLGGGFATLSIYVGDKLGLYKALAEGPCSVEQLADKTGYHRRWVEEWLFQQAANKFITHDGNEIFSMTPVQKAALADNTSDSFAVGTGMLLRVVAQTVDRTSEGFTTGIGCTFDDHGKDMAQAVACLQNPWTRNHLVQLLRGIAGVEAKLNEGIKVADIGCGSGESLMILGAKFPKCQFHGYDISEHANAASVACLKTSGLTNVHFHNPNDAKHRLPEDHSFGLIINLDAIHDMANPLPVVKAIGKALAHDGVWISSEPHACGSLAANLKHPMAAVLSGFSMFVCMSSAMSEPDAAGLGTMGLSKDKFDQLCEQANLHIVKVYDGRSFGCGKNVFYEIRPKTNS